MKTYNQIKDEVCQKYGHRSFTAFKVKCLKAAHQLHDMIPMLEEVAKTYAEESVKHHLDKAAENANIQKYNSEKESYQFVDGYYNGLGIAYTVNKQSIINTPIELL